MQLNCAWLLTHINCEALKSWNLVCDSKSFVAKEKSYHISPYTKFCIYLEHNIVYVTQFDSFVVSTQ